MNKRSVDDNVYKASNKALSLLQNSFNVGGKDVTYGELVTNLNIARNNGANISDIDYLLNTSRDIDILKKNILKNEINEIATSIDNGKFGYTEKQIAKEIDRINRAIYWLDEYSSTISKIKSNRIVGIEAIAQEIYITAVKDAPLLTGALRDSAYYSITGSTIEVGFDCPYAFIQHEHMEFYHPVGKAKFLEDAVQHILPDISVEVVCTSDNGSMGGIYWSHTF